MKNILVILISISCLRSIAQTVDQSETKEKYKSGFLFHGISYETGQEGIDFAWKNPFDDPFYQFHELGIQLQLGADGYQQRLLHFDIGLSDNDNFGAGYYAKVNYALKMRPIKGFYIAGELGHGIGQYFFHNDLTEGEFYEDYEEDGEFPRLFIHAGAELGIDLESLIKFPFEIYISRQVFKEFWSASDQEVFDKSAWTIGATYTF